MEQAQSQNSQILKHLQAGKSITPLDALRLFDCLRLSGRIYDLKKEGHPIKMLMVNNGKKRYANYFLEHGQPKKENRFVRLLMRNISNITESFKNQAK